MGRLRKPLAGAAFLIGLIALLAALFIGMPGQAQEDDQSVLARLVSRALSTPATRVSIGRIEGALSSNATIHNLRISDRDGEWLVLERARLVWSRLALLRGRLQVDELEIDGLDFRRHPAPVPASETTEISDQPILPELPVKVVIQRFVLNELTLGEPIAGVAARLGASGNLELGDPAEGLTLALQAQRLDQPGRFAANLSYVPNTQALTVGLDFDEPAEGLAARLLNLPGLPPVTLKVAGQGPLDGFAANLDFTAGPTIGAEGRATLARSGQIRRLNLDLGARIEGLVPEIAAPVVRGDTRLAGSIVFGDDGGYAFEKLNIATAVADIGLAGHITADRNLDLTLRGRALPTEGTRTRAGDAEIGRFLFDAHVSGPIAAPRVNGTLDAADIRTPAGNLASLAAEIGMDPVAGRENTFSMRADARARGIAPADRAMARAIGNQLDLALRGTLDAERVADLDEARIATPTASASFTGKIGARTVDGTASARLPALASFSGVAGRPLAGAAVANVRLSGDPARTVDAAIDARLTELSTGTPALDGLLGRSVTATGTVRRVLGGFAFSGLRIDGANLDVLVDGSATEEAADLNLKLDLPDLRRADQRLTGRVSADARLTGSLERPNVSAKVEIRDASALQRPIPRLDLALDAKDVTGALDGNATLSGEIGGKPARGTVSLARIAAGGWNLRTLDVTIGSVAATGAVQLDADYRAAGSLSVKAGNLDDISPLLLTRLGGSLDADIELALPEGRQNARIRASGDRLAFADQSVRNFKADAALADIYGRPVADGLLEAAEIRAGGQNFQRVRLAAKSTPAGSDLDLSASAQGFALQGRGRLVPGDPLRLDLASFNARRGNRQVALAGPARIAFADGGVALSDVVLAVDRGRVAVSGRAGSELDLTVDIRELPLAAAEIAAPGIGLAGTLNGAAHVTGPAAAPSGTYRVAVAGLALPATRNAGLPAITARGDGRFADGRATVAANVAAGRALSLNVNGSVPLAAAGTLDVRANGRLDAAIANATLGPSGQSVRGTANVDVRIGGTIAAPQVNGTVDLANGSFTDQLQGVRLDAIAARLVARGDAITVERLSARTPNGGTLSGSGRVTIDPAAGFPADIRVTANRAQLASNETVTAVANLDLRVSGPVTSAPRISGRIDFVSLDVTIPDRLPATLQPLPGTRHVRPTAAARQRLALRAREGRKGGAPFNAALDLTVSAPNRVFVRGRGLNAELGGDLRLTGTSQDPVAIGAFELRRGRFDILGQRIDLTRGRLSFGGDLSPELDIVAETQAADITARVGIQGSASQPSFVFSSTPDLLQDEVISRLLFGRASGGLSAGQALQLAQVVAQFAGGGSSAFEDLRKSLGVDSLDISTGTGGGVTVGASRYISDRISVGVRGGARPEDAGVTVNIDVTRRIKAQAEAGADGRASAGIGVEWEY